MKKLLLCTVIVLATTFKANAQFEGALIPYLTELVVTNNAQLSKDIASATTQAEQATIAAQDLEGSTKYWEMAEKADQALTDIKAIEKDMRVVRILEQTVRVQRRAYRVWERTKRSFRDIGLQSHEVRAIRNSLLSCIDVVNNLKTITEVIFSKELRTDQGQRMMLVDQTLEDVEDANRRLLKVELYLDEQERDARRINRLADDIGLIENL